MFRKSTTGELTELVTGVHLKTTVYGEKTLMTSVKLEKSAVIPAHRHPHEQTGFMVSGHMDFLVNGEHFIAEPGDSWSIAAEVEHGATALEDSLVVEVFSPVREDYLAYFHPKA